MSEFNDGGLAERGGGGVASPGGPNTAGGGGGQANRSGMGLGVNSGSGWANNPYNNPATSQNYVGTGYRPGVITQRPPVRRNPITGQPITNNVLPVGYQTPQRYPAGSFNDFWDDPQFEYPGEPFGDPRPIDYGGSVQPGWGGPHGGYSGYGSGVAAGSQYNMNGPTFNGQKDQSRISASASPAGLSAMMAPGGPMVSPGPVGPDGQPMGGGPGNPGMDAFHQAMQAWKAQRPEDRTADAMMAWRDARPDRPGMTRPDMPQRPPRFQVGSPNLGRIQEQRMAERAARKAALGKVRGVAA